METQSWYEIVTGDSLLQGDLLLSCPARFDHDWPTPSSIDQVSMQCVMTDLIVLTQTCDLQHGRASQVLLAQVSRWVNVVQD